MTSNGQLYKIKLSSGRILGPVDLDRIRLLILKNQIIGKEIAREYPDGEWQDINRMSSIAELLIARIAGTLQPAAKENPSFSYQPILGTARSDPSLSGETVVLNEVASSSPDQSESPIPPKLTEDDDKTKVASAEEVESAEDRSGGPEEDEKTMVGSSLDTDEFSNEPKLESESDQSIVLEDEMGGGGKRHWGQKPLPSSGEQADFQREPRPISEERTILFSKASADAALPGQVPIGQRRQKKKFDLRRLFVVIALLGVVFDFMTSETKKPPLVKVAPIRPELPSYSQQKADPQKSIEVYNDALRSYLEDTAEGYRVASEKFREAAGLDSGNVKALAFLASSYINLIDSSNKDETYFSVISKLIEMSRVQDVDLSETVIADVEFYITVNKAEAAQKRIVEYTKSHPTYGLEMFYYLGLAFYARGDWNSAARFISQVPEDKAFSPKIFYLRGQIAEKLKDNEAALREYSRAVALFGKHAKSRLRMATIRGKEGKLADAEGDVEFLISHTRLMSPQELAQTYFLHAQISELHNKFDIALADLERAVRLDPENHDFLLELYTLRGKAGESSEVVQKAARMYFFLGEGERLIQQGKYEEALVPLLEARQADPDSALPLVKIGDMFSYLHHSDNARVNYKLAAERAPDNIQVWSKYIQVLIQTYEWEEATQAMDRFRKLPVSQSAIDKAAADIYQKQGRYAEAQTYYRKAMSREAIDPAVYFSYAKSLMAVKNFKDAPFFFALALRFDPLNIEAITLTSKCIAETDSIDRGISMLQDEMSQRPGSRAEFLAAIAELQMQSGRWEAAQESINEAIKADATYPLSYKLQALVHMNREATDKDALVKALDSLKSYIDRNPSDASGYLERYKIFARLAAYDKAYDELLRIYEAYPKYPQLHYYLGALYAVQANHKAAIEEFRKESVNNPNHLPTILALGRELLEAGKPDEALKEFNKAMRIDPRSSEAKHYSGWANRSLKNFEGAIALLRAAAQLDPGNPLLYKRLAIVFRESGRNADACGAFRKYLEKEPDAPDKDEFPGCI